MNPTLNPQPSTLNVESVWVDGFSEMSEPELELLVALLPHCRRATITFCLDRVPYHGRELTIVWDRDGKKFGREAQLEERVLWNEYEKKALEKARAAGIQIIEISDKKPFQDAVKPVWDKYGPKYAEVVKRIQAVE